MSSHDSRFTMHDARPKDICVIYNPASGRGQSTSTLRCLQRVLGKRADFRPTSHANHAEELAREATEEGFPVVVAAGGDGTVHEVGNGILSASRNATIMGIIPIGSANDYAYALMLSRAWWRSAGQGYGVREVDVGSIRADGKHRYFLNGMGVGFNGAVTLEARRIKRLRGIPLYAWAVLRAMRKRYDSPSLRLCLDDQESEKPTLALTLAVGPREGNFILAPNAVLDDGELDVLQVGPLPRRRLIRYVPRMISGRVPTFDEHIMTCRCRKAVLEQKESLLIHTDGEFFCLPEEGVTRVEVEVLPKRLRVMGRLA